MKDIDNDCQIRQLGLLSNHLNLLVHYMQQITLHVDLERFVVAPYAIHIRIKLQMRY